MVTSLTVTPYGLELDPHPRQIFVRSANSYSHPECYCVRDLMIVNVLLSAEAVLIKKMFSSRYLLLPIVVSIEIQCLIDISPYIICRYN